jgi:hypothetical protein
MLKIRYSHSWHPIDNSEMFACGTVRFGSIGAAKPRGRLGGTSPIAAVLGRAWPGLGACRRQCVLPGTPFGGLVAFVDRLSPRKAPFGKPAFQPY